AKTVTVGLLYSDRYPRLGSTQIPAVNFKPVHISEGAFALHDVDALFVYVWGAALSVFVDGLRRERPDKLRWLHVANVGVEVLMVPEIAKSDVIVTNSRGVFDEAIAEYVLGCILYFVKDIDRSRENQKRRSW